VGGFQSDRESLESSPLPCRDTPNDRVEDPGRHDGGSIDPSGSVPVPSQLLSSVAPNSLGSPTELSASEESSESRTSW
jgi:hypothetical protein